jgi:hypothetical protein
MRPRTQTNTGTASTRPSERQTGASEKKPKETERNRKKPKETERNRKNPKETERNRKKQKEIERNRKKPKERQAQRRNRGREAVKGTAAHKSHKSMISRSARGEAEKKPGDRRGPGAARGLSE